MDSVVASAVSAGGRTELPRQLLEPMQRQLELVQEVIERERKIQKQLAGRIVAPLDAVFDLLEESGLMLRKQAEALKTAGRALEETATLVKTQAELFERTIGVLREPAELAKEPQAWTGGYARAQVADPIAAVPARRSAGVTLCHYVRCRRWSSNPGPSDYKTLISRVFACVYRRFRSLESSEFPSDLRSSGHSSGHGLRQRFRKAGSNGSEGHVVDRPATDHTRYVAK